MITTTEERKQTFEEDSRGTEEEALPYFSNHPYRSSSPFIIPIIIVQLENAGHDARPPRGSLLEGCSRALRATWEEGGRGKARDTSFVGNKLGNNFPRCTTPRSRLTKSNDRTGFFGIRFVSCWVFLRAYENCWEWRIKGTSVSFKYFEENWWIFASTWRYLDSECKKISRKRKYENFWSSFKRKSVDKSVDNWTCFFFVFGYCVVFVTWLEIWIINCTKFRNWFPRKLIR